MQSINKIKLLFCVVGFSSSLLLTGCRSYKGEVLTTNNQIKIVYDEVIINGCEYLVTYGYNGGQSLTHKGNCKNPIHPYNKVKTTIKIIPPKP
jgi:hypothetical protein